MFNSKIFLYIILSISLILFICIIILAIILFNKHKNKKLEIYVDNDNNDTKDTIDTNNTNDTNSIIDVNNIIDATDYSVGPDIVSTENFKCGDYNNTNTEDNFYSNMKLSKSKKYANELYPKTEIVKVYEDDSDIYEYAENPIPEELNHLF